MRDVKESSKTINKDENERLVGIVDLRTDEMNKYWQRGDNLHLEVSEANTVQNKLEVLTQEIERVNNMLIEIDREVTL